MLEAVSMFMVTPPEGAIGALDYPIETRKLLAQKSKEWCCPVCKRKNDELLPGDDDEEVIRQYELGNYKQDQEKAKANTLSNLVKQSIEQPKPVETATTTNDNQTTTNKTTETTTTTNTTTGEEKQEQQ
eukprot:UN05707